MRKPTPLHLTLLALFALALAWSAIHPFDRFTWWLEVAPALIGAVVLIAIYPRFRFTDLIYTLILIHMVILFVGGHYTYALVPLGSWMQSVFHLARNDYDRIGHFAQGFVPALIAREVLWRVPKWRQRGWLFIVCLCVALAISAAYELFEWRVAVATGSAADAFLGTQGDVWDTQEDMATALVGAIVGILVMSRWQDRQISRLESGS